MSHAQYTHDNYLNEKIFVDVIPSILTFVAACIKKHTANISEYVQKIICSLILEIISSHLQEMLQFLPE